MKKTITLSAVLLPMSLIYGQVTFQTTTDLTGNDYGNVITLRGNTLDITGSSDASGGNGYDIMLLETDLQGNSTANFHAGGTGTEYGSASYFMSNGHKVIAGRSSSYSTSPAGVNDVFVTVLDTSGSPVFLRVLGTDSIDYASSVREANDGNIIIGGRVRNNANQRYDGLVVKLDVTTGATLWSKSVGTPYANEVIYDVKSLGSGNGYVVAGYSGVNTIGLNEAMFIVLNDTGGVTATFLVGGAADDDARIIADGPAGKFFLVGNTRSFGAGLGDIFVARFDVSSPVPTLDWFKTYGGNGEDAVNSALTTSGSGLLITGISNSFGSGGDALAFEIDQNGNLVWSKNYGGSGADYFMNATSNGNGGYYVVGYSNSFGATNDNVWIVEMDSTGTSGCNETPCNLIAATQTATLISPPTAPTADFVSNAITLIDRNAMANISSGSNTATDATLCLFTGINDNAATPTDLNIFPNPASETISITGFSNSTRPVQVVIYNMLGEVVLEDMTYSNSTEINVSALQQGIYSVVATDGLTTSTSSLSIAR